MGRTVQMRFSMYPGFRVALMFCSCTVMVDVAFFCIALVASLMSRPSKAGSTLCVRCLGTGTQRSRCIRLHFP